MIICPSYSEYKNYKEHAKFSLFFLRLVPITLRMTTVSVHGCKQMRNDETYDMMNEAAAGGQ